MCHQRVTLGYVKWALLTADLDMGSAAAAAGVGLSPAGLIEEVFDLELPKPQHM
jgi:hypothetical protein